MKRQRNTQQVKEQDKCPPNQTKLEEIGNLLDKELQIMVVKMIQNLEIKMESQINSLETRTEKMQERFNKDLEEIKNSQYIMNNTINDIKTTLVATNGTITEPEDRICSLCLIFVNLVNMCLGVFHLGFILFGTLWVSWTWVIIFFPILGKFSTIIPSSIFSWFFFWSSSSGTPMIQMLGH